MDYKTFRFICDLVGPHIRRNNTNWRTAWRVEVRVAIALRRLGHGESYRALAHLFGVSSSSCNDICKEVFKVLWSMRGEYITWGPDAAKEAAMVSFGRKLLPGCLGAIDGCHIPIESPARSGSSYRNRKGWHSIILSAVVDHNRRFVLVDIGMPGRNHDAHVYRSSKMYGIAKGHFGVATRSKFIRKGGVRGIIKPYIIGDPAYPISPSLMKAYPGVGLSLRDEYFNFKLSSSRMCVEQAFGIYKSRWRLFRSPSKGTLEAHVAAMSAACVLHNICIEKMTRRDDPEIEGLRRDNLGVSDVRWEGRNGEMQQPGAVDPPAVFQESRADKQAGEKARELLAKYIYTFMPLDWRPRPWREGGAQ